MNYEAWGEPDESPFDAAAEAGWLDPDDLTKALIDVMNERDRQHNEEGWTPELDDAYPMGKLAQAGAAYAMNAGVPFVNQPPTSWPFAREWWKPKDPRRDLVRAAALILAEIEKIDRSQRAAP